MTQRQGMTTIALAIAFTVSSTTALAASHQCGIAGSWQARTNDGALAMFTISPGTSATVGQLVGEWVLMDPTIGGRLPATRITGPVGVWEKVDEQTANFTWLSYGIAANGLPIYAARVSGLASLEACDLVNMTFTFELFLASQDMSSDDPVFAFPSGGSATRMVLVVLTP